MGLTDKMMKKLMDNPEVQYKMILGFIDSLISGMDKVTEDIISNPERLSVQDYKDKLISLYDITEKNIHRIIGIKEV